MKKQETTVEVATLTFLQKLHKAKQSIGKIHKNATNPHFKKSYADLTAILEIVEPILHENGLIVLQPVKENVVVTQIIDIDSGDMIESFMTLPAIQDPQKILAAITYFRRATIQSCLSLSVTDDDDGNSVAQAVNTKQPTVSDEMVNKFLESVRAGVNKWSVQKFMDTYDLTTAQKDILILHQL